MPQGIPSLYFKIKPHSGHTAWKGCEAFPLYTHHLVRLVVDGHDV